MVVKRFLCILLIISLIVTLNACGCEHEWANSTCEAPKTCKLCGDTEGELGEHNFEEANCVTPKKCKVCGTTEGEALGHAYSTPDCVTPKMCSICGTVEGTALGHNYVSGYCERCGFSDPDYVDLNKFGFTNMYGMNVWLEVCGYDFANNRVLATAGYKSPTFNFKVFYGNYFRGGWIRKEQLVSSTNISADLFGSSSTTAYNVLSNDVITYDKGRGVYPATITERVVDSSNSKLVMKTNHKDPIYKYEYWYVPADLLDFSTIELYEKNENNSSYSTYSINFK